MQEVNLPLPILPIMNPSNKIAQHPLLDKNGNPADFLIEEWGDMSAFSYDYLKAHRHNFYEVLFFEKGKAKHDIDFDSFAAKGGDVHFFAPDNVHMLLRGKNSLVYSVQFTRGCYSDEIIDKLPFYASNPTLKLGKEEFNAVNYLMNQIRVELAKTEEHADTLIRSYFDVVLNLLIRNASLNNEGKPVAHQSHHIEGFKKLVKENYQKHYSVSQYADLLNISVKHLIETCKEQTVKTPLKLVQGTVISEAKRQLYHTQTPIKEIAYLLGFDDPANFSKYFKSASGFSPQAYRQESGK